MGILKGLSSILNNEHKVACECPRDIPPSNIPRLKKLVDEMSNQDSRLERLESFRQKIENIVSSAELELETNQGTIKSNMLYHLKQALDSINND